MLIALLSSLLSVYIVLKRLSLIGDGLAHTAFGGLAVGLYVQAFVLVTVNPFWVAAVIVILGSIGVTYATRSTRLSGDAAVAVFLELGLASGIFLVSLTRGYGVNLDSLLFGSILLVSWDQIYIAVAVLVITAIVTLAFYKELLYTTFDEIQARASGIATWKFDYMISILAGVTVIAAIPIVGILLISALLVLPALTSIQVSRSFRQTVLLAPAFGLASVFFGLLLSIATDTASGAAIVLIGLGILLLVLVFTRLRRYLTK